MANETETDSAAGTGTAIVIAQTTVDDELKARELARRAVELRLAACAHIDPPVTAVYRWKGSVESATEWRVSYRTTRERLPALAEWVGAEHAYDVPEWIVLPVTTGSAAYLAWVAAETAPE
ncbi:divalent-cation tolerance protein CutA [Streptomyces sp. NBC_00190]|uniref:divalent-cation tolerance protein CutA n=1 Tax=unclassified Streptomyces TaxID=2593676 RepID=UPI002E2C8109|nr:divalent-cation tolerance protein CutA [Streptomyces sp. NBC_00190]WSZ40947.1 divalent-cation tolerance protein CutA [Streptomyces sp. NBC_00868]